MSSLLVSRLRLDQPFVDPLHRPHGLRLGSLQDQGSLGAWSGNGGTQRWRGTLGPEANVNIQGFPQDRGAQGSCWTETEQVAEALPCPDLGLKTLPYSLLQALFFIPPAFNFSSISDFICNI